MQDRRGSDRLSRYPFRLVPVDVALVRTLLGQSKVLGLDVSHDGELDVASGQVGSGNFFVECLGKNVDTEGVGLGVGPEGNLGEDLVGERARHDEGRVTVCASEVDQSTFGKEDDVAARGHGVSVDLRLNVDVLDGGLLQPSDINFDVEMSDVADDSIFRHGLEVLSNNDVTTSSSRDEDVGAGSNILHSVDFVTSHRSLKSVDRVDLGDNDTGTVRSERLGTALSDVTVSSDDGNLSSEHDVGGTLDSIDQTFTASVVVVELALGDGVVDVDGRDL